MTQIITANQKADQFRAEATKLRERILNSDEALTKDELVKLEGEITALEHRAALAGQFTPRAEIERQGGDTDPVQRVTPEGELPAPKLHSEQITEVRTELARQFGTWKNYLHAVIGRTRDLNPGQKKVMERVRLLTRTIIGDQTTGGEYLLPLQQEPSIFAAPNVLPGVLQHATRYTVRGRSLRLPQVQQTDGDVTRPMAGVAAVTIVNEAGEKPVREPVFIQRLLTVYKWAAIWQVGDETFDDDFTNDLGPTLIQQVGGQVVNTVNEQVTITGTGTSQPLGAFANTNPALLKVSRGTTNTITTDDIFSMYAQHTHGPGSRWYVSRSAWPEIMRLTLGSNTLVSWLTDLRNRPTMMLMGYPIEVCDIMNPLGQQADLGLVNPAFYAVGMRQELTVESSIHFAFQDDITTWRAIARAGGIPIPNGTYAYRASGGTKIDEHSPFVVLDDVTS